MKKVKKNRQKRSKKEIRKKINSVFAWVMLGVMVSGTIMSSAVMIASDMNNSGNQIMTDGVYSTDENGNLIKVDDVASGSAAE